MTLTLERKDQTDKTPVLGSSGGVKAMLTPSIGPDYWRYRVMLSDKQAIIGFPKFMTIGIGFAVEKEDWNTNLPYRCSTEEIFNHIKANKGDDAISDADCLAAIRLIQDAATEDRANAEGRS